MPHTTEHYYNNYQPFPDYQPITSTSQINRSHPAWTWYSRGVWSESKAISEYDKNMRTNYDKQRNAYEAANPRPTWDPNAVRRQPIQAKSQDDARQAIAPTTNREGAKQALAGLNRTNLTGGGTLLGGLNLRRKTLLGE